MIESFVPAPSLSSIMGEGAEQGIIPQFSRELFERTQGTTDDQVVHTRGRGQCLLTHFSLPLRPSLRSK